VDIPTPEPGPRMVLVKFRPAGMNPMALAPAYGAWKPMPVTILSTFALGPERTRALPVWGAIAVVGGAVRLLLGGDRGGDQLAPDILHQRSHRGHGAGAKVADRP
jgi:hypothetical protein